LCNLNLHSFPTRRSSDLHIMIQKNVDVGKDLGRNFIYLTNITMETNSILVGNSGYYAEEEKLKATPVVQNGRTLLGVRDIAEGLDRKSTRLNSSHVSISY